VSKKLIDINFHFFKHLILNIVVKSQSQSQQLVVREVDCYAQGDLVQVTGINNVINNLNLEM